MNGALRTRVTLATRFAPSYILVLKIKCIPKSIARKFAARFLLPHRCFIIPFAIACLSVSAFAQQAPVAQPVAGAANLLRLEGTDPESGIHYVRLMLSLPAASGETKAPPRFTVECTDNGGKRDLYWVVSFGGVSDTAFTPPFHRTPQHPNRPKPTTLRLTMTFEGYMKWKPLTRAWALLPSGELRYENPGMHSPNMESLRLYSSYLNSLPGLRIRYAQINAGSPPEVFFQTRPLLDEMAKTPLCQ